MSEENFPKRFRGEEIALLIHVPAAAQVAQCREALAAILPAWHHFRGCEEIEDERTEGEVTAQAAEELLTIVKAHAPLFGTLLKVEMAENDDKQQLDRLQLMLGLEMSAKGAQWIAEHQIEIFSAAVASRSVEDFLNG